MHWFDLDLAAPQIARVLVPGGVLAGLWNVNDDREEWVAGLSMASDGAAGPAFSAWRTVSDEAYVTQPGTAELFAAPEHAEFPNGQRRTADTLLATLATHSRLLVMPDADRARLLAQVRSYLGTRPETSSGEFTLPMVTSVVRAIRR